MLYTTEELLRQIRLGEDSSLEFKSLRYKGGRVSEPHRNSVADALAAMANTASGVFVLGVDDKTNAITGIDTDKLDAVELWLRNISNDLITPPLFYRMRKIAVAAADGTERNIIRVDVPKSLFVHQSPGGYFERIGASKRQMTPDRLARLFQQRTQARMIYFDEQAVPNAPVDCLDKTLWKKFATYYSSASDEVFLLKLRFLAKDDDGVIHPTVSGVLMASRKPHEYLRSAYIQAVAYRSPERNAAYQFDSHDITGPLDRQIVEACAFVKKNMRIYAIKNPAREDIPQYSMQAVFEAIVNAVAHRDYSVVGSKIRLHLFSDRLEITSPGSIPNTLTLDTLALRQVTRNELLSSTLARCPVTHHEEIETTRRYFMERRGEGVPLIIKESQRASGRAPTYTMLDGSELTLTIYAANVGVDESGKNRDVNWDVNDDVCGVNDGDCGVNRENCGVNDDNCGVNDKSCGVNDEDWDVNRDVNDDVCGVNDDNCGVNRENCGVNRENCGVNQNDCGVNDIDTTIISLMTANPEIKVEEIANATESSKRRIEYRIAQLKNDGIITREGADKKGRWVVNSEVKP